MKIVLDTNVLVSGLLSPTGPPGRIVDLVATARLVVVYDDRIIAEYREVLARPRLRIEPAEATAILDLIVHEGLYMPAAPLGVQLPDPDDLPFLEVAVAASVDALVTGNGRHFRVGSGEQHASVHSPAEFLAKFVRLYPAG